MAYKPNLSRMARLAAGSRPPAPGQDPLREEELRIELTEEFKPESLVEKIWVEDVAYRAACIEVIRAQIAGFRSRAVKSAYGELVDRDETTQFFDDDKPEMMCAGPTPGERVYSAGDREELARCASHGFVPRDRGTLLDNPSYALLLGGMGKQDLALLRQLQVYEHEEMRERDRIINQFERRRRQAMRHAIEMIEARRRAALGDGAAGCAAESGGQEALTDGTDDDDIDDPLSAMAEDDPA